MHSVFKSRFALHYLFPARALFLFAVQAMTCSELQAFKTQILANMVALWKIRELVTLVILLGVLFNRSKNDICAYWGLDLGCNSTKDFNNAL